MTIQVGDSVKFFPTLGRKEFRIHVVQQIYPVGFPSMPKPMAKLHGVAGSVDLENCELHQTAIEEVKKSAEEYRPKLDSSSDIR